jgi:hypothetical protein
MAYARAIEKIQNLLDIARARKGTSDFDVLKEAYPRKVEKLETGVRRKVFVVINHDDTLYSEYFDDGDAWKAVARYYTAPNPDGTARHVAFLDDESKLRDTKQTLAELAQTDSIEVFDYDVVPTSFLLATMVVATGSRDCRICYRDPKCRTVDDEAEAPEGKRVRAPDAD